MENGENLKYNVYYAASGAWNNTRWTSNNVLADAALGAGSTFANPVTVGGLTDGVSYTFGVRVQDRSGNEDADTRRLTATPTERSVASSYDLMVSGSPDRSGAGFFW